MERVRRLSQKTAVRYLAVGCAAFTVELACLLGMYHGLRFSLERATAIAYWIGLLLAFGLQKFVAFRDHRRGLRVLTWQSFLFGLLTAWNWVFTVWLVGLFPAKYVLFSRPLAQVIFAAWNYFLYKNVIFSGSEQRQSAFVIVAQVMWLRLRRNTLLWWSVGLVAVWRLALEAVNQAMAWRFYHHAPGFGNLQHWAKWDGGWYLNVNHYGYQHAAHTLMQENVAFFPAFPEVVGWMARLLHVDYVIVGIVLNLLLTVGCVYLLMKLAQLLAVQAGAATQKRQVAFLSGAALLAYPASFFLGAYYGEALLLFATLGAIYATLRRRLGWAVLCLAIATATKVSGVVVVAAAAAIVFEQWRAGRESLLALGKRWLAIGCGLAGLLAYMVFLQLRFGDPLLFYKVEQLWGRNTGGFFLADIMRDSYLHILQPAYFIGIYRYALYLFMMALPFLVGAVALVAWRKYRLLWPAALGLLVLALPLSTGVLDSLNRYCLLAAPLLPLAVLWLRGRCKPPVLYVLLALSFVAMLFFAHGFFREGFFAG